MKKTRKAIASLAIAGMALTMIPFNAFAAGTVPTRLAGVTAEQTAVAIADQTGWTGTAILASSASYGMVDALTSGPLAKYLQAPVLLQGPGNTLNADTKAELTKLNITKVYVASGTAVISQAVINELKGMNITVESLGGFDRFATSANIAQKLVSLGATVTKATVAYGWLNQDALSIASIASAQTVPILLTEKNTIPASVKAFLTTNTSITSTGVIGGTGVISDAVQSQLPNANRVYGNTAYDTNVAVLKAFDSVLKYDHVFIANGETAIDALTGAPLAAQYNAGIVLTNGTLNEGTAYVRSKQSDSSIATALGGTAVIPDSVLAGASYLATTGGGGGGGGTTTLHGTVGPDGTVSFSNGVTISDLPVGATVTCKSRSPQGQTGTTIAGRAEEITVTTIDGKDYEPTSGVHFEMESTSSAAELSYYDTENSKWEILEGSTYSDGKVKALVYHFSTYGPIVFKSAQAIADGITSIPSLAVGQTNLTLPEVPTGYNVSIASTSNPSVITLEGKVSPAASENTVDLTLKVTEADDSTKFGTTGIIKVVVPTASAEDILIAKLMEMHGNLTADEKAALKSSRDELKNLPDSDPAWDEVVTPLLTPEVKALYGGDESSARTALITFIRNFSTLYYSDDAATLKTNVDTFKKNNRVMFRTLFGNDFTIDLFYGFLTETQDELLTVIKADKDKLLDIFNKTSPEIKKQGTVWTRTAMHQVADDPASKYHVFVNKLSAIKWNLDKLVEAQRLLGATVDKSNAAEKAIIMANIRSQIQCTVPTSMSLHQEVPFDISIKGVDTSFINLNKLITWGSDPSGVVEITLGSDDKPIIKALKAGTTHIYAVKSGRATETNQLVYITVTVH